MTRCRSRGETEGASQGIEPVQCRLWCSAWRLPFPQAFAPETQFAGRFLPEAHCLALECLPLDRSRA
jgi:hypothetical protein